jgi:uncharacterized membrane protein
MSKPTIKIQMTNTDWLLEVVGVIIVALMIAVVFAYYNELPITIPRHFNALGQPDGFGGKSIELVLPMVGVIIYLVMTVSLHFPKVFNYPFTITEENADRQYKNAVAMIRIVKTLVALMFFYLTYGTIQTGLGQMQGLGVWFAPVTLAASFGTVGVFIYKAYRLR